MRKEEADSIEQFDIWAKYFDKSFGKSFYYSNKAVIKELNLKPNDSLLDVGCGTGILLSIMNKSLLELSLYGVDISSEMVIATKQKLGDTVHVQQASAMNLPFESNSFDIVKNQLGIPNFTYQPDSLPTSATSFHHYPDSLVALKEIYRVLKPNGTFVLLDPFLNGLLRKSICSFLDFLTGDKGTFLYTKEAMEQLFIEAGFLGVYQKKYLYYKLLTVGKKQQ